MTMDDTGYLAHAMRLAGKGRDTHPNPRVGCVLVHHGRIVGEGYHARAGEGHAEANALAEAGAQAAGATAYVTLEPCSFHGRTPSCADALVAAGVSRVVVAMPDPDPRNAGQGIQKLEQAGIDVTCPLLEDAARALNPGHVKRHLTGLPFVRLKLAMSLDGKTALANGESKWITSPEARQDVRRLRAESSAIVTGVQTVIDDDPVLSVKELSVKELSVKDLSAKELSASGLSAGASSAGESPINRPVYVLDPGLRTPPGAKLLQRQDTVLVAIKAATQPGSEAPGSEATAGRQQSSSAPAHGGCTVLRIPGTPQGKLDLHAFLIELARREHNEVLFECGRTLAGAMIAAQLVDELVLYVAPRFMGSDARSLLKLPEIDRMSDTVKLVIKDICRIGVDFRITATLDSSSSMTSV